MSPPSLSTPATCRLLSLPAPLLNTVIASVVDAARVANDALPGKGAITRFHAKEQPQLELEPYLSRSVLLLNSVQASWRAR